MSRSYYLFMIDDADDPRRVSEELYRVAREMTSYTMSMSRVPESVPASMEHVMQTRREDRDADT